MQRPAKPYIVNSVPGFDPLSLRKKAIWMHTVVDWLMMTIMSLRDVAQLERAPAGAGGYRFESYRLDKIERWPSGLWHRLGKAETLKRVRRFESCPLCQNTKDVLDISLGPQFQ